MALHPQSKIFLDFLAAARRKPLHEMTPAEAREMSVGMTELAGKEQPVAQIADRTVPGPAEPIPVRVYTPVAGEQLPALLYFHGGAWILGDLDSFDRPCRALANSSGCTVISVAYRLAPENKFPAALEDCYAATRYVAEHAAEFNIDPGRIAVAGDSAGGNLAAAVTLMARDQGGPAIAFQLLVYPAVDSEDDSPSMREFADGYFLTRASMDHAWSQYFATPSDARNPYACPLKSTDFRGLPAALIITAECDPLRDQGEIYARRLEEAGARVGVKRYPGAIHPFFQLGAIIEMGNVAIEDAAAALRQAFDSRSAQPESNFRRQALPLRR